jgi:hypothetical protein
MNEHGRIWSHYEKWEDWQNGMYSTSCQFKELYIGRAQRLLSNPEDFSIACDSVIKNWPISTAYNLSNPECNRNAWLGQAACCFVHGVPEILTRVAWGRMSNMDRFNANKIASFCINNWVKKHEDQKKNQLELFGI